MEACLLLFKLHTLWSLLTTGLCLSIIFLNSIHGDIYPLLKEPCNFHTAMDKPQRNLGGKK